MSAIRLTRCLPAITSGLLTLSLLILCAPAAWSAAIEERDFANAAQRDLYNAVIKELRCLVCQNQNLAESDADLAKDLRDKTYDLINQGKDRNGIVDYMVTRYGDFVLYRPPFKLSTAVLWLGPLLLLVIGAVILWKVARRRSDTTATLSAASTTGVDIETARRLLTESDDDSATDSDNSDASNKRAPTPSRANES